MTAPSLRSPRRLADSGFTPTCRIKRFRAPARIEPMQPIKVAIVDDQQLIRSGLSMLINSRDDLTVTGEAANGQQALHSAHIRAADVVLLDVRMPVMDGLAATDGLLELHGPSIILLLTPLDADEDALEAIAAGAI